MRGKSLRCQLPSTNSVYSFLISVRRSAKAHFAYYTHNNNNPRILVK